jgi:hypothetical protein
VIEVVDSVQAVARCSGEIHSGALRPRTG